MAVDDCEVGPALSTNPALYGFAQSVFHPGSRNLFCHGRENFPKEKVKAQDKK